MEDLNIHKQIANGTFSKVFSIKDDKTRVYKVVKRFPFENKLEKMLLENEIYICKHWPFDHKGLVKCYNVLQNKNVIVYELEHGGINLESVLYNKKLKDDYFGNNFFKYNFIQSCIETINYLYNKDYMHFDIKPANILINANGDIKFCDYDMLLKMDDKIVKLLDEDDVIGTLRYLNEDIIKEYSLKRCLWSLGLVFFEICYGYFPVLLTEIKWDSECKFNDILKCMFFIGYNDDNRHEQLKDIKLCLDNLFVYFRKG